MSQTKNEAGDKSFTEELMTELLDSYMLPQVAMRQHTSLYWFTDKFKLVWLWKLQEHIKGW